MNEQNKNVVEIVRPPGVYDAGQAVNLTLETMEQRSAAIADDRAISRLFGIPQLDRDIVPFWPGDYVFTCGLPSNGKSFFARMQMLRVVNKLVSSGHTDRAVVWITTEESVERVTTAWMSAMTGVSATEILSGELSQLHVHKINDAVAQVASWPIYIVGSTLGDHSSQVDDHGRQLHTTQRMTTAQMEGALDFIASLNKDIIYITLDYLQRVRQPMNVGNREEHIRRTIDWGRDMAHKFSTPFNMITQAKFELFHKDTPVPGLYHSEWSANAGQSADAFFGVCMPQVKPGVGATFSWGKFQDVIVERGMMIVYMAKQKMGLAQESYLLRVKPDVMEWELLDVDTRPMNPEPSHTVGRSQKDYMNTWQPQEIPLGE